MLEHSDCDAEEDFTAIRKINFLGQAILPNQSFHSIDGKLLSRFLAGANVGRNLARCLRDLIDKVEGPFCQYPSSPALCVLGPLARWVVC